MPDEKEVTTEVKHPAITNVTVISDGGSAGRVEFELKGGGKAVVSASIQQPSPTVEPTGGGDPESKAKLAGQKAIAEEAAEETPAEKKGPLPEGFPSKSDLEAAGITTHFQLRKKIASGTEDAPWFADIKNVGPDKAAKIEEAEAAVPVDE